MTEQSITAQTRARVASFLPESIARALGSYRRFMEGDVPDDAKGFSAHHTACKVAIAHVELLLKLARWAELPDETVIEADKCAELKAMINQAEFELKNYNSPDCDQDDGSEDEEGMYGA